MSAHERSSSSCTHSTLWTFTSSSWTTPSRSILPSELSCSTPCAPITQNEDYGPLAETHPPTSCDPNVLDASNEFEVLPSIFQGSNVDKIYNLGVDNEESANAEIDDEHIRNSLALPLFLQENDAKASLKQTYHSYEECLFKGAQSISAGTERSVVWPTQKRKSSQQFDDERISLNFGNTEKDATARGSKIRNPETRE